MCMMLRVFVMSLAMSIAGASPYKPRLVSVVGEQQGAVEMKVGDVVCFQPFRLPTTPKNLKASMKVSAKGDKCLATIGGLHAPDEVIVKTLFFWAMQPGKTTLKLELLDGDGEDGEVRDTEEYHVEIK